MLLGAGGVEGVGVAEAEASGVGVVLAVGVRDWVDCGGVVVKVGVPSAAGGVAVGGAVLVIELPGLGVGDGSIGGAVVLAVKVGSVVEVEPGCERARSRWP